LFTLIRMKKYNVGTRVGSPIGAAVLQHPNHFLPKKKKNEIKKLGIELVKYSGFKEKFI